MAKVKYDISDVDIQDLGDFEQAPVGLYRFKIAEATVGKSNAGQPMLTVVLELTHDAKGKKLKKRYGRIWHRVPLEHWDDTAGWTFRLKEFLSALGLKLKGTIDPDKLEDMTGMVKLRSGKDLDDNYRPEVGKLMKLADDEEEDEPDEDDEEDEDEDEEEETEEDEDEDEDEEEGEWDEEQLGELSTKDLKSVADEFGVDVPARLTSKSKTSLIAAILEAQSGGGEDEEEDEEDEEEEETETEDYADWSRNQLIKEARSRDMKVKKSDKDDDIRQWLIDSDSSDEDEEEDEEDEEEEETSYGDWELDDLKNELKERGLKATGPKNVLVKRLEKDDESKEDPF